MFGGGGDGASISSETKLLNVFVCVFLFRSNLNNIKQHKTKAQK
jgi:hypothetical protein